MAIRIMIKCHGNVEVANFPARHVDQTTSLPDIFGRDTHYARRGGRLERSLPNSAGHSGIRLFAARGLAGPIPWLWAGYRLYADLGRGVVVLCFSAGFSPSVSHVLSAPATVLRGCRGGDGQHQSGEVATGARRGREMPQPS